MPILTTGGFFQEFNFDTLLALISLPNNNTAASVMKAAVTSQAVVVALQHKISMIRWFYCRLHIDCLLV